MNDLKVIKQAIDSVVVPMEKGGTFATNKMMWDEYDKFPYNDEKVQIPGYPVPPVPPVQIYTFGGLQIAKAPLSYDGEAFVINDNDDWSSDSYNDKYGLVAGSYYFSHLELGKSFDSDGDAFTEPSSIDNEGTLVSYDGNDDWRIPTKEELDMLITTDSEVRPGSTVNDAENKHFAIVRVDEGSDHYNVGILLFPDNQTITGAVLVPDTTFQFTSAEEEAQVLESITIDLEDLNEYLEQGCVFLGDNGFAQSENWLGGCTDLGADLTGSNDITCLHVYFSADSEHNGEIIIVDNIPYQKDSDRFTVRLVRDAGVNN